MEDLLLDILKGLRSEEGLDERALKRLIDRHNHSAGTPGRAYSKRKVIPFYLRVKAEEPERHARWGVTPEEEARLFELCRVKPGRTASGVATVSVITRPWPCSGECLYCPSDVRMPKSYLHAEPACRRAERAFFDPYLQVVTRLRALSEMGHPCDKVELIILGGTWTEYPERYQVWFVTELFQALNDGPEGSAARARERRAAYECCGVSGDPDAIAERVRGEQARVDAGDEGFASALKNLYGTSTPWEQASAWQRGDLAKLAAQQRRNESARHRCVGLVVETRPDCIDPDKLVMMRKLGCTKVQMGVQSLDQRVLDENGRHVRVAQIARAFALLRLFGFKIHAHFMANLLGATPEGDEADYRRLVTDPAFMPDEVKLYPCALIAGTGLEARYADGSWRPYDEETLVRVLASDVLATPPYCRVSRMIRDFSAGDIVAGNKKANLRQPVEARLRERGARVEEIRFREIGRGKVDPGALRLETVTYQTSVSEEAFLQWVSPGNSIAGFLRLSLPLGATVRHHAEELPVGEGEAMIREVHVYGSAERLGQAGEGAQHLGLGRRLVSRACEIARERGYARVNVISAVGTREYYRRLGFSDNGLYQTSAL